MDYKQFGEFLSKRRKQLHVSRSFIAEKLGYSKQIVYSWEKGNSYPNLSCWDKLSEILQIDINGLLNCKVTNRNAKYKFDEEKFVFYIKELRIQHNLTQKELADKIGVNHKTISSWENDSSLPTVENFISLAQVFNIDYMTLFYAGECKQILGTVEEPRKRKLNLLTKILISSASAVVAIGATLGIVLTTSNRSKNALQITDVTSSSQTSHSNTTSGNTSGGGIENPNPEDYLYSITFKDHELKLELGETKELKCYYYPNNVSISWQSSDSNIVAVSNGLLVAKRYGSAIITARIKNKPQHMAQCVVKVGYYKNDENTSLIDFPREATEFFEPVQMKKATFLFEDKKTIIYEKLYEIGDQLSYDFDEPTFGPYYGWEYNFLGWDINDDGVTDTLPETITKDLTFVALYSKTPTSDLDFLRLRAGEYRKCYKQSKTIIIPSDEYTNTISPSELYQEDTSPSEVNSESLTEIENIIYMEGLTSTCGIVKYTPNLKYVRYSSSINVISEEYPKITINRGYIPGKISNSSFKNGVDNSMLLFDYYKFNEYIYIPNDSFKNCTNLEYIKFKLDKTKSGTQLSISDTAFEGCVNLKSILYDKFYPSRQYIRPKAFIDTQINYFDLRFLDSNDYATFKTKNTNKKYNICIYNISNQLFQYLDPTATYNILLGLTYRDVNMFGSEADPIAKDFDPELYPNVHLYYYNETSARFDGAKYFKSGQTLNGWHFDKAGFPTLVY